MLLMIVIDRCRSVKTSLELSFSGTALPIMPETRLLEGMVVLNYRARELISVRVGFWMLAAMESIEYKRVWSVVWISGSMFSLVSLFHSLPHMILFDCLCRQT